MLVSDSAMWGLPFISFCISLAVSLMLTPILIASAEKLQFLDYPGGRKVHAHPIAKIGGVGFGVGVFVTILLLIPKNQEIMGFLLGGFTILLFGVWDDRVNLGYRMKFFGQILAAGLVLWFSDLKLSPWTFHIEESLPEWMSVLFALVFLVGVTNAFNLSDGLDGLAGGLALLSLGGMIFLAQEAMNPALLIVLVALAGGILGFLRFNTFPARIFMGDGGSQYIGFSLGVTALMLLDSSKGGYSLWIGLMILGLPILDTLQVMSRRIWKGLSPFIADRNHLHHHLIRQGLTQDQTVILIYSFQGIFVGMALFLRWYPDWAALGGYVLASLGVIWFFFTGYGHSRFLFQRQSFFPQQQQPDPFLEKKRPSSLSRWTLTGLECMVPCFFVLGILIPDSVPPDCGLLAWFLGIFLMVGKMVAKRYSIALVRLGLYTGATLMLYLLEFPPHELRASLSMLLNGFFLLLTVLVVRTIMLYRDREFQLTTLDYLFVVAAVVIPLTIGWKIPELNFGLFMAKMILVFFSFELMLTLRPQRVGRLQQMLVAVFGVVGLSAWWSW